MMQHDRFGAAKAGLLLAAAGFVLSACNALSGIYGSAADEPQTTALQSGAPTRLDMDPSAECPQVTVPTGMSAYAPGAASSAIRFQASIQDFARECVLNPDNTVTIRIGVQGLMILGERGGPGAYTAPLRIAIRDRDGRPVYSKLHKVGARIAPGEAQAAFRIVDNGAKVPISLERPLRYYDIVVGFDPRGGGYAAAAPEAPLEEAVPPQ